MFRRGVGLRNELYLLFFVGIVTVGASSDPFLEEKGDHDRDHERGTGDHGQKLGHLLLDALIVSLVY